MNHSARFLRTALTAALLCVSLAVSASALTYGTGTVTGDTLRLRSEASTSSSILTTVTKGTQVVVLENQTNGWYKVDVSGSVGYMSADYLSVTVQAETDLGTGTLNTDGASLNLRSGPGTGYSKVASIPANAELTITGIENGWYKTSYNGNEGYVSSDYITLSASSSAETTATEPIDTTRTGIPNTDGSSLNLRSGPGTGYSKVASIPSSAVLTITDEESGWYKTSYNGKTGYVSADYITIVDSASAANSDLAAQVIAYAKQFMGLPYVYGSAGPNSFDCSGYTSYVYKHFGYSLNRSAAGQYSNGTPIDMSQIQPGDLILWRAYGSSKAATHVGIYIGNNQYIHASSTGKCITINDMDYGANSRYVVGVRRILT